VLPRVRVEPLIPEGEGAPAGRVATPRLPIPARRRSFAEVETALSAAEAAREARRCLRCDLAFTEPAECEHALAHAGGGS
jgi:hypothetical protein